MIKFKPLPKFTLVCYALSLLIIGLVFADQFLEWQLLSRKIKIATLVIAAIIGVAGSLWSIGKQLAKFLQK
ncbi:hypothetical protein [Kangiella sp. TOML190]|uniref:hypothetical protein n=1 Tax=Kangiella sp. TOML190 TaxID=2931351 RepID=UPI00203EDAF0|nr:hypothetical protein [Kangiella sp. TOML190]